MFRKDDRVWDFLCGWGVVYAVSSENGFPVKVKFDNGLDYSYTSDGRSYASMNRSLFFREFFVPEEALERPRFRAIYGETYLYISGTAEICRTHEAKSSYDDKRFKCGNYFETEKELKDSDLYKAYLTSK